MNTLILKRGAGKRWRCKKSIKTALGENSLHVLFIYWVWVSGGHHGREHWRHRVGFLNQVLQIAVGLKELEMKRPRGKLTDHIFQGLICSTKEIYATESIPPENYVSQILSHTSYTCPRSCPTSVICALELAPP